MEEASNDSDLHDLRTRLMADVAAGKTVVLSKTELASPRVRERLPQLLEGIADTDPAQGQVQVPGYTMLGEIGRGGMSTVHLARHDTLGRHVALKVAPKWIATDPRTHQRLLNEARAMARVKHPNVVAIHDVIETGDSAAIAMEWIDGLTLASLLRELPPQPTAQDMEIVTQKLGTPPESSAQLEKSAMRYLVRVMHDIARAAHAVHEAGLLHLDIKPSNILIRRDGTALLADFGVVRELDLETTHTLTFAGTPVYASLEQLRRDDDAFSPATDVYALGITLYEALARRQPVGDLDLKALVETVAAGRIPLISGVANVAPDLATIVHKSIAPEPALRYPTAAAFADDLLAFLEGRPIQGKPLPRLARVQRWARNEPWKAALVGVLLVLLPISIGIGGYLVAMAPRIEESRRQERIAEAMELKQSTYQQVFLSELGNSSPYEALQKAYELDPSPVSLACLLSALLDEQDPNLAAALQQHAAMIDTNLGLRLVRKKAAEHRSFFTDAEVADLRASGDPTDHYVLALDRVLHADDRGGQGQIARAMQDLEAAYLMWPDDPLLLGLQTWTTSRTHDRQTRESLAQAIQGRWRDNFEAQVWVVISYEFDDPDRALALMRSICAEHSRNRRSTMLLITLVNRLARTESQQQEKLTPQATRHFQEVVELAQRALATGRGCPQITSLHCLARRALGDKDAMPFPDEPMDATWRWGLNPEDDKATLDQRVKQLIAAEWPSHSDLVTCYRRGETLRLEGLLDTIWDKWTATFPDRHGITDNRMRTLFRRAPPGARKDYATWKAIGSLAPKVSCDFERDLPSGIILATGLVMVHDWASLLRHAEDWRTYGAEESAQQAECYLGMAMSRLGDYARAARHLAFATDTPPEKVTGWYRSALVEKAWQLVADGRPTTSSVKRAAECLERYDALPKTAAAGKDGRWIQFVRASVTAAQGDTKRALALAQEARQLTADPQAPDDLNAMLAEAIERWSK